MPITTERFPSRDLTVFTPVGSSGLDEQIAVLKDFYEATPTRNVLWDFRNIRGKRLSSGDLRLIIEHLGRYRDRRPPGKTALVSSTELDFGLSRMSGSLADSEELPWKIQAFSSFAEAESWLDET